MKRDANLNASEPRIAYIKYAGWLVILTSLAFLVLSIFYSLFAGVFSVLFQLVGANVQTSVFLPKEGLGFWFGVLVFFGGFISGLAALKQPNSSGIAIIAITIICLLFGSTAARIFGIILLIPGIICVFAKRRPECLEQQERTA
ncbi:hypothetical protein [Parazoarcus communis]|uniref:hypothetical protein n=1 Tax=Parazoarcus communis TaxID=41977 RepID=UPI00131EE669|nr:hypothetical protein [Parazoarcus communis]